MANIKDEAKRILPQIVEWRRHIHAHPELGLETPETEAYIVKALEGWGSLLHPLKKGIGGHGVAAVLQGDIPGQTLAIRADLDALPIKEETGLPLPPPMAICACAHDAHTAMALGAAKVLINHRRELKGSVKFIFQPAEETVIGAKAMIDDGVLENPKVNALIALHTGCSGKLFRRTDWIFPRRNDGFRRPFPYYAKGKGATERPPSDSGSHLHGWSAYLPPSDNSSREINPVDPAVLTIGRIAGGSAYNIIPGECILGTVRVLDVATRKMVEERIRELTVWLKAWG